MTIQVRRFVRPLLAVIFGSCCGSLIALYPALREAPTPPVIAFVPRTSGTAYTEDMRRGAEAAATFDAWLGEAVRDPNSRDERLTAWRSAPGGRESHPRSEHLIPLMVAAGAGGGDVGVRIFNESIAGKPISGFQFG